MDFVRSHFGLRKDEPLTSWTLFWAYLSSLLGGFAVGLLLHPPKSDDKYAPKRVQLVRVSSFRSDFLQNPYFRYYDCRFCPLEQFKLTDLSFWLGVLVFFSSFWFDPRRIKTTIKISNTEIKAVWALIGIPNRNESITAIFFDCMGL